MAKDIHWSDLQINRFNKALNPSMLTEEGYHHTSYCKLAKGQYRSTYRIHYDREYVVAYLAFKVINQLGYDDIENLNELWIEALRYAERKNKQQNLL